MTSGQEPNNSWGGLGGGMTGGGGGDAGLIRMGVSRYYYVGIIWNSAAIVHCRHDFPCLHPTPTTHKGNEQSKDN